MKRKAHAGMSRDMAQQIDEGPPGRRLIRRRRRPGKVCRSMHCPSRLSSVPGACAGGDVVRLGRDDFALAARDVFAPPVRDDLALAAREAFVPFGRDDFALPRFRFIAVAIDGGTVAHCRREVVILLGWSLVVNQADDRIVVIGASAGGGRCVVAHRPRATRRTSAPPSVSCCTSSPGAPSLLPEILRRVSRLLLVQAEDGRRLERGFHLHCPSRLAICSSSATTP